VALRIGQLWGSPREQARRTADYARAIQGLDGRRPTLDVLPMEATRLARGMLTSKALARGRGRPWPLAFTRQLDPGDPGFIPRSLLPFVLNQNFRDWVAVGLPDHDDEAVVDPGGWLTPWRDGPSVAVWVGDSRRLYTLGPLPGWGEDDGHALEQTREGPVVRTTARRGDVQVELDVFPTVIEGDLVWGLTARVRLLAPAPRPVRVGFAIRPANPEGVSPIFDLERRDDGWWLVDGRPFAYVPHPGHELRLSSWARGDVYGMMGGVLRQGRVGRPSGDARTRLRCPAGLATGAELYRVNMSPGDSFKRTLYCSRREVGEVLRRSSATRLVQGAIADWDGALRSGCRTEVPVYSKLLMQARTSLLAMTDRNDVTCGPLQHARAPGGAALHLAALVRMGHRHRAARVLRGLPAKDPTGALNVSKMVWACVDHVRMTGDQALAKELMPWLLKKAKGLTRERPAPNAPVVESIWVSAALRGVAEVARSQGRKEASKLAMAAAERLETLRTRLGSGPVPSSPDGDLDSAAVRALVACWPLDLLPADEPALQATLDWLLRHCMHQGGLFHDVEHAGVNPVMTAVMAQVRLRAGDPGALEHLDYLAENASSAGTWPEAFLPGRGGVVGEGDHAPACAAFIMLVRDLFVREEGDELHLFHGADARWWSGETVIEGLPTAFGPVDLLVRDGRVRLRGRWRRPPAEVICHAPLEFTLGR
jgi:hypothetical protein